MLLIYITDLDLYDCNYWNIGNAEGIIFKAGGKYILLHIEWKFIYVQTYLFNFTFYKPLKNKSNVDLVFLKINVDQ